MAWDIVVPIGVEASARNGNVTISGTVQFGAQRDAAFRALAGLTGVRNIKNEIGISVDADPVDVRFRVEDALDRWALIPHDSDVQVSTEQNYVTSRGMCAPGRNTTRWSTRRGSRLASRIVASAARLELCA